VQIAQIAPPWLAVPPQGYGGVEAVVGTLTEQLVERGHDVTLFSSGRSTTRARHVAHYDRPLGTAAATNPLLAVPHLLDAYARAADFDVIHDHTFPIGPSLGAMLATPPVVHTVHTPPDAPRARATYGLLNGRVTLVATCEAQASSRPDIEFGATIYNGVNLDELPFSAEKDDHLLFVGRMSPKKGAHLAVEAAIRLGRRLVLVTKLGDPEEKAYFEELVRPRLTDAVTILLDVDRQTLAGLYGRASCLVAPMQWSEPFGLVMVEAMATGTPVVALRAGATPEIVDDGVTGFLADDLDELVDRIPRAAALDPAACRRRVAERFSADQMAAAYERLYAGLRARVATGSPA
jgi:glycosyltransferase involved in cell wall biosynthesis